MTQPSRIAILNAHSVVHSSIGHLAASLEARGYEVDIFLFDADGSLSGALVKPSPLVRVHSFGADATQAANGELAASRSLENRLKRWLPNEIKQQLARVLRAARQVKQAVLTSVRPLDGLNLQRHAEAVANIAKTRGYCAIVGVEKGGLAWAGAVAAKARCPLIYYSLELYARDHPFMQSPFRQRLKTLEERFHKRCALTIVQDVARGNALLSINGVRHKMRMAYLPVSVAGPIVEAHSQWFHEELRLPPKQIVILSFGVIFEHRPCIDLILAAQNFRTDWTLVLHGFGAGDLLDRIRQADGNGRVRISARLLPVDERPKIIRAAKIGLALYYDHYTNDRLTGRSSEKIALYLQCGVPVIAFRYESYEHLAHEGAAVLIDRLDELREAIDRILSDYPSYVKNAYACYERHYRFESNFEAVFKELQLFDNNQVSTERDLSLSGG